MSMNQCSSLDKSLISDVHFKALVAEMTGGMDQFYVELPRKSQKIFAKALITDVDVPSALRETWNVGV